MRILRSYQPGEAVNLNVLRNRKNLKLTATLPERDVMWWSGEQGDEPDGATAIKPAPRAFRVPGPPPREEST